MEKKDRRHYREDLLVRCKCLLRIGTSLLGRTRIRIPGDRRRSDSRPYSYCRGRLADALGGRNLDAHDDLHVYLRRFHSYHARKRAHRLRSTSRNWDSVRRTSRCPSRETPQVSVPRDGLRRSSSRHRSPVDNLSTLEF